eukprot:gene4424-4678_t
MSKLASFDISLAIDFASAAYKDVDKLSGVVCESLAPPAKPALRNRHSRAARADTRKLRLLGDQHTPLQTNDVFAFYATEAECTEGAPINKCYRLPNSVVCKARPAGCLPRCTHSTVALAVH